MAFQIPGTPIYWVSAGHIQINGKDFHKGLDGKYHPAGWSGVKNSRPVSPNYGVRDSKVFGSAVGLGFGIWFFIVFNIIMAGVNCIIRFLPVPAPKRKFRKHNRQSKFYWLNNQRKGGRG